MTLSINTHQRVVLVSVVSFSFFFLLVRACTPTYNLRVMNRHLHIRGTRTYTHTCAQSVSVVVLVMHVVCSVGKIMDFGFVCFVCFFVF